MTTTLTRKGYARIYVANPQEVGNVEALIKELDEFEFEYLPGGMQRANALHRHHPHLPQRRCESFNQGGESEEITLRR